jgi:predicted dinucleotide-binding enzyme
MNYSIIGSGNVGTALARLFARKKIKVVFVSSNDADASATVAKVATRLGFAPIELGRLDQGGVPLHALNGEPGGLMFQNVEKLIGGNHE